MPKSLLFVALCLGLGLIPQAAEPCTTFALEGKDGLLFGKSYDWSEHRGLVVINKKGLKKRALRLSAKDQPAEWVSKYASITFNQYGVEMPNGGMNERGLVVEIMWLNRTKFPSPDTRPTLNELQWIQYQLDNFADVSQVLGHLNKLRISAAYAKVHYLVCDKGSACAAIEFIDHQPVVTSGPQLFPKVLTNSTYARSRAALNSKKTSDKGNGSLARFIRASKRIQRQQSDATPQDAFEALDGVSQGAHSKWNIVYQPRLGKVHFRSHTQPAIKTVTLSAFDPSCRSSRKVLDIDSPQPGVASTRFSKDWEPRHRRLVQTTVGALAKRLPPGTLQGLMLYPRVQTCVAPVR